jgi:hypothetical protein
MAKDTGWEAKQVLTRAATAVGLALVLVSGVVAADRASELAGAQHTRGTVFALSGTVRGFAPVVQFTLPSGGTTLFTAGVESNPPAYQVGEQVPMVYPPDEPEHALIDSFWQVWFYAAVFALIGVALTGTGVAVAIADVTSKPRGRAKRV